MANTKKKYNRNNKTKKRLQKNSNANVRNSKMIELFKMNRKRNKMIRNIRMGRSTFNRIGGGGQTGGSNFISQFIGKPWNAFSEKSNYFAQSPNGVGTGVVPINLDGQPLGSARFPTQHGPQLAKLGHIRGGGGGVSQKINRRRTYFNKRNKIGGGLIGDLNNVVSNVSYKMGEFYSKLDGQNPPPNPNPYDQPIQQKI